MRRGEVWWVKFDELRPAVLVGGDETSGFQAIQVVPPSGMDISGLGIEVPIGAIDGLAYEGVLRLGLPNPDFRSAACAHYVHVFARSASLTLCGHAASVRPRRTQ